MVTRTFYTPTGPITRDLIEVEINQFAQLGDIDCKKELLKRDLTTSKNVDEKIDLIIKFLGVNV